MQYENLILIGSSHVSSESVSLVKKTIEEEKPGVVAVELDSDRLEAMFSKKKRTLFMRGVGVKGMLFGLIGAWVEKKIGKVVGVEPGSEMKAAINLARKNHIKLALIDQNIAITLRRFSQTITWKEKLNFVEDILRGIITPKKQMKKIKVTNDDLSKVPDEKTIKKLIDYAKKRYPNFYNILVHERNIIMANNLVHVMNHYPNEKIVAVVGAGHKEAMMKLIREKLYKHSED